MPKKATRTTGPRKEKTTAKQGPNEFTLHIVSDATGTLANHLVSSVLTQFPDARITKVFHVFQDTPEKVARLLDRFHGVSPFVVHAVIDPESKRILRRGCVERRIRHLDLTQCWLNLLRTISG